MLRFVDTRTGIASDKTFSDVVLQGIAPSGGLFVPESLPHFSAAELAKLAELSYAQAAAEVFKRFDINFCDEEIDAICAAAYGSNFDDERIIPISKIKQDTYVLELWHGPTSAFKDMALQCMPLFFSGSLRRREVSDSEMLILVATSGDTGKAALAGFAGRESTRICVLFPDKGVSQIQRLQMTTQLGEGVKVLAVRGNFDDCQRMVKELFVDAEFKAEMLERFNIELSSANSINLGRLLPQIVYYLVAPLRLAAAGELAPGQLIDVVVPTGNFGNILAAYYAKKMGAPLGRLICASNENNVLSDFINTGTYDIRARGFIKTPSPSMDILVSSNLERFLYHLAGAESCARWMKSLSEEGYFTLDEQSFKALQDEMLAGYASNNESLANIKAVYETEGYLMEPHTSVAELVGAEFKGENPLLVASTAHWAKFGSDVFRALHDLRDGADISGDFDGASEFALLKEIARMAPGAAPIPSAIAGLEQTEPRFKTVIDANAEVLRQFLLKSEV